ncbi:trimethylamine monooxygenase-like [Mytilus galloprovincialis]|uniref:trimethylamine monooxygenase-like n=1 Tax=Mytilus galloprovincialis TaxID=29158 RepID=UPI003F7B95B0
MTFPGFEQDSTLPTFPTQDDIFDYLRRYIDHCDLEKYMKFNTVVTKAVPKHPDDFKTKWEVTYCHVQEPMNTTTEDFDAVIVCSGNCVFPNVPPFPGLKDFKGRLLHSRNYRKAKEFRGQTVAVIGSSYSGKDVARQLSDVADKVYIVHIDQPLNTIYPNGNVIEKNYAAKSITNSSLILANREEIEIDSLILCTGYRYRFPFLSEDILSIDDEHVSPLYKHVLHLDYHSLMVITLLRNIATYPISSSMGKFARAVIDGNANLPLKIDMKKDIASEVQWRRANKLVGPRWHYMDTLQWDFDQSLALIGKFDPLPELLQIYWNFVERHRENDFINYWKYDYHMNGNNKIVATKREKGTDFNLPQKVFA